MAEQKLAIIATKMHAITLTVTEVLTLGTLVFLHPLTMTIGVVTVFPYFHEVVLIDIALIIVGTDTGTSSNRAIGHHRTYRDASLTREKTGTHLTFVITKETLASIIHLDATFLSRLLQILKNATKLLIIGSLAARPTGKTVKRRQRLTPLEIRKSLISSSFG